MLRFLAAFALLAVASTAFADDKDKPRPTTLTPKEIADGWILLFDGETTFGWKVEGKSEVKAGVWHLGGGEKVTKAQFTTTFTEYDAVIEADGSDGIGTLALAGGSSGLFGQPMILDISAR